MPHVFISYARKDADFVTGLRQDLKREKFEYWIDTEGLLVSTPSWERAIRKAIEECDAVIWVVTPASFDSAYVRDEIAIAKLQKKRIFPVWAEGNEWLNCVPLGTGEIHYADMRHSAYRTGFEQLLAALRGHQPQLAVPQEPTPILPPGVEPRNPYKGLAAFTENDTTDFFGREALVKKLVNTLQQNIASDARFLAVLGPSGAGKSSVVMAGLIPALRESHKDWTYLPRIIPGAHPVGKLADSLSLAMPNKQLAVIEADLNAPGAFYLSRLANQLPGNRVVLYVDQFEEVFTLTVDENERQQFISLLTQAATEPEGKIIVLLTMRADFYGHPANYPQLGALINTHNQLVLPMTIAELRDAIEKPARASGLQFDPELPADIIFALRERDKALAGALPLLQFTLERLYAQREGNILTRSAYEDMNGVQGAIGQHSETVFASLPENVQASLGRVFLPLVNIDEMTGEATRRRASLENLDADSTALLSMLVKNRLLQTGEEGGQPYVEIAHEALLSSWPRLAEWIDTAKVDLRLLRQVEAAAREWDANGRRTDYMWSQERLEPVYAMREQLEVAFDDLVEAFIYPETARLLDEIKRKETPEHRQMAIIDRLTQLGQRGVSALAEIWVFGIKRSLGDSAKRHLLRSLGELREAVLPVFIEYLHHEEEKNRRAAAVALGMFRAPHSVEPLITALDDPDYNVRRNAAEALGKLADPSVVDVLIIALTQPKGFARYIAPQILGKLADPRAVEPLINLLHDPDVSVRRNAAKALGKLADPRAVEPLINLLHDPDVSVRRNTAEALKLTDPRAVEPLINLLHDPDVSMRRNAAEALGKLADPRAVEPLITALDDPDYIVRRNAAEALGKLTDPRAVEPLMNALNHPNTRVRYAVAEVLGKFTDPRAVEPLINALNHPNTRVRCAAAEVLGKLADPRAVEPLINALNHPNTRVRCAAAEALGKLSDPRAVKPLITALNDPDIETSIQVAEALEEIGTSKAKAAVTAWDKRRFRKS